MRDRSHPLRTVAMIVAVLVIGAALGVLVSTVVRDASDDEPKDTSRLPVAEAPAEGASVATMSKAEFNRIEYGSTVEQVERVVGGAGQLIDTWQETWQEYYGTSDLPATYVDRYAQYQWYGEAAGASAVLIFKDGGLFSKDQAGLR